MEADDGLWAHPKGLNSSVFFIRFLIKHVANVKVLYSRNTDL